MKKNGSIHTGHRRRLTENVLAGGKLTTVQLVEAFLFYCFRQGDTNETAHRLLDKFGTLENLLHADEAELASVKGMGPASSRKLRTIFDMVFEYRRLVQEQRRATNWTYHLICGYFSERILPRLLREDVECVLVILKDGIKADSFNLAYPDIFLLKTINSKKLDGELSVFCIFKPFSGYEPPSGQLKKELAEIGVDAVAAIPPHGKIDIELL